MAGEAITIEEAKKARIALEKQIFDLIKAFEKKYKIKSSYISLDRKGDEEPIDEERGPLNNVNVSMELDVLYD